MANRDAVLLQRRLERRLILQADPILLHFYSRARIVHATVRNGTREKWHVFATVIYALRSHSGPARMVKPLRIVRVNVSVSVQRYSCLREIPRIPIACVVFERHPTDLHDTAPAALARTRTEERVEERMLLRVLSWVYMSADLRYLCCLTYQTGEY